jgi:hypothetical protein
LLGGAPLTLPADRLVSSTNETLRSLGEEFSRTDRGFPSFISGHDPDSGLAGGAAAGGSSSDPLQVWRLLPALKNMPDHILHQLSRSEIFQLNTAVLKESKVAGKLQANTKLTMNAQQLMANPVNIPGGLDDRKNVLHPARFLGGASCSAQELWLRAREHLGLNGVIPLGNYDLDSIGCGGCVTPRGWTVIHDPSSSELKLKLFHLPNVNSSSLSARKISLEDGESAINIGDSLKDIADMDALKSAINTLREAMASALPWNRSISALCGFFANNNFCASDLNNVPKKAVILTEFSDYVLQRNALNWENKQPFMSSDDLAHAWAAWKAKRSAIFSSANSGNKKENQGKQQQQQKTRDGICRRYNSLMGCPNAANDCKTFYGSALRHVCNKFMPGGKKCEKDHPRPDHK